MAHGTQLALFNEAVDYMNNPRQPSSQTHHKWLNVARGSCILSLAFFLVGSCVAVVGFLGGLHFS